VTRLRLVSSFLLTLICTTISLSQERVSDTPAAEPENPKTAIKVDEFGKSGDCAFGAHVDNFFIQLHNNPDSTGYIITYNGTDLMPSDYKESPMADRIRKAIAFRRYDDSHVVFVNGGFREAVRAELYLVPPGAIPPEPTETVPEPKLPKGTFLWSESYLGGGDDEENYLYEFVLPDVKAKMAEEQRLADIQSAVDAGADSDPADLVNQQDEPAEPDDEQLSPEEARDAKFDWVKEKFGAEIASRKNSQGVLLLYADDQHYDITKLRQFVGEGRDRLAAASKIDSSRIEVVFGGYRDIPTVEYYIVPKGGKSPEPKPGERQPEPPADQAGN